MSFANLEEVVARSILRFFPASQLKIQGDGISSVYEVVLKDSVLITIDGIGATFSFPTRGSEKLTWSGIKEGSPDSVVRYIIQDLADAGFTVFNHEGKKVPKSPVFVGKHTFCPQCNEAGLIRKIIYGAFAQNLDTKRFLSGGSGAGFNDPESKCVACGWEGPLEDVRFTKNRNI